MKRSVVSRLSWLVLEYFRFFARLQLRKIKPVIVGITGSAGKTTTMHAVEVVLRQKYSVKSSYKANSQSGLSLNILGLSPTSYSSLDWLRLMLLAPWRVLTDWKKYEVYVAEMGIDGPDEPANMSYLLKILKPHIGVMTSVTLVHAQAFDHLVREKDIHKKEQLLKEAIAGEKMKLLRALPRSGTAIYAVDEAIIADAVGDVAARKVSIGRTSNADLTVADIRWDKNGTTFLLRKKGANLRQQTAGNNSILPDATVVIANAWLPEHYGSSFAAAAAVGEALDISLKDAAAALSHDFELPPGRASLFAGLNGSIILDSTYNSAPAPLADFLKLLQKLRGSVITGRVIGLLGDMRELGNLSAYAHTQAARIAAETFDEVYLVGPEMREHALPILNKRPLKAVWFPTAVSAVSALAQTLKKNDLLFVKGSQNTLLLEIAIEKLLHDQADAKLLCRRGTYWDRQREALKAQ